MQMTTDEKQTIIKNWANEFKIHWANDGKRYATIKYNDPRIQHETWSYDEYNDVINSAYEIVRMQVRSIVK